MKFKALFISFTIAVLIFSCTKEYLPENEVTMFIRKGCPWCEKKMAEFDELGIPYDTLNILADNKRGLKILDSLKKVDGDSSGRISTPSFIINGTFIDGNRTTSDLNDYLKYK